MHVHVCICKHMCPWACMCMSVCVDMCLCECVWMHEHVFVCLFHKLWSSNCVLLAMYNWEAYISTLLLLLHFFIQIVTLWIKRIMMHCYHCLTYCYVWNFPVIMIHMIYFTWFTVNYVNEWFTVNYANDWSLFILHTSWSGIKVDWLI